MKHVTIIATSLSETSKSQRLAAIFEQRLIEEKLSCERIDLRALNIPFAGTSAGWSSEDIPPIKEAVARASHIVFAVPIYCYDVNAAAKNLMELVGKALTKKVIGFICSAGGRGSYMSVMGFANHMMLDFRSVIVPRFVYASDEDWTAGDICTPEIEHRLDLLLEDMREIQVMEKSGAETPAS
jgi:NAD(P)H-dependent FMN reductase